MTEGYTSLENSLTASVSGEWVWWFTLPVEPSVAGHTIWVQSQNSAALNCLLSVECDSVTVLNQHLGFYFLQLG